jgi:hypothetical protein
MIFGILLLPVCVGAVKALWRVLQVSGQVDTIWVPVLAGAACWLVVFLSLPKPMRLYVFGHELTHALWTLACGGKVLKFKTGSAGGHVVVTKNNFLVALAPYFFPVYAVLVLVLFVAGHSLWNWTAYLVWFHLLIGAAYCFHVTLTWHILQTDQSDITGQGYLFSTVIIFLGNISVLLAGLPLLTAQTSFQNAMLWWWQETIWVLEWLRHLAQF